MSDLIALFIGAAIGIVYFDELSCIGEAIGQCIGNFIVKIITNGD